MIHDFATNPRPIFFGRDEMLFGWLHPAVQPSAQLPVVICNPIGYEQVRTHRTVKVLAERLANNGTTALRFDYITCGDSWDVPEEIDKPAAWLASIRQAIDFLMQVTGSEQVALVGIRLGGTLVSKIAEDVPTGAIVLWEPVESGKMFCREMQIVASAAGPQRKPRREIDAGGFLFSQETQNSLSQLSIGQQPALGSPPILYLQRDDLPPNKRRTKLVNQCSPFVTSQSMPGFKEMMLAPQKSVLPTKSIDTIVDWLGGIGQPPEQTQKRLEFLLEPDVRQEPGGGEKALQFGPAARLFGLLTLANLTDVKRRHSVILLCGGTVPHYSANRMYVPLARRLAASGYDVLRMDLSGIGDSSSVQGGGSNIAYTSTSSDDIRAAMDAVAAESGARSFTLIGLCSGAYAALEMAKLTDEVDTLILVNQLVYYVSPTQFEQLRLGQIDAGEDLDFPRTATPVARIFRKALNTLGPYGAWAGRLLQHHLIGGNLSRDLTSLAGRGTHLAFIQSEDDPSQDALMLPARTAVHKLIQRGSASMTTIANSDHTFSPSLSQTELIETVTSIVSCRNPTNKI